MLRRFGANFVIFSLAMDAAAVWLALAIVARFRPELVWLPFSQQVGTSGQMPLELRAAVTALWIFVLLLYSFYDPRAIFRIRNELRILVLGSAFAGLASAGLTYLSYREVSRWLFVLFVALAFSLLFAWRMGARLITAALRHPTFPPRRVLVVGAGAIGQYVGRLVDEHRWAGLTLVGYLDDAGDERPGSELVLGRLADLREVVQRERVDEVLVALADGDSRLREVMSELLDIPLHVRVVPSGVALALDRPAIEDFAGVPLVDLRAGPLSDYQRAVKRLFDLAVGAVLTLVTLPIMGVVAILVKLDSPGPVLFRQARIGENGRSFAMYKFRTMVQDAEKLQAEVIARDAAGHLNHKWPDDPRVTRLGHFLRRTSLDELPQFVNVLRGEMSLVGPRPELPWLADQYEPWQRRRLVMPPGLTGWWQVNGRSDKPMHLHTDVDLYYVTNYSFWLDLRILWKTLWVVLQGRGAH